MIVSSTAPYGTRTEATVSVVIPTFDRAALLERAVLSCLSQTCPVHEVLVCDDGSTDDSQTRMAALGDPRIKWLPGPHAGRPAVPRNRGVKAATGEWLAFLDSDDEWEPEKLAFQMKRITQAGTLASCTNAERIMPTGTSAGLYFNDASPSWGLKELLKVNRVICSSAVVKRDLVIKAGGFPEAPELKALEDYALWLRIAAQAKFAYCAVPLVRYADAPESSVRSGSVDVNSQRDVILSGLLEWDDHLVYKTDQRREIVRHLRRARRYAGRPIWDWLFLR